MILKFSLEDLCFLLEGNSYDFFPAEKIKKQLPEAVKEYVLKKGWDGQEITGLFHNLKFARYMVVKPNAALLGPQYTDAFFISEAGVTVVRKRFGKYVFELLQTREEQQKAVNEIFLLDQVRCTNFSAHLDMASETAEEVITCVQENDIQGLQHFAEQYGISAEDISFLINGAERNDIHIEVHRIGGEKQGAIALGISVRTGSAMRFIASPDGNMTCFETMDQKQPALDYIVDFKGK